MIRALFMFATITQRADCRSDWFLSKGPPATDLFSIAQVPYRGLVIILRSRCRLIVSSTSTEATTTAALRCIAYRQRSPQSCTAVRRTCRANQNFKKCAPCFHDRTMTTNYKSCKPTTRTHRSASFLVRIMQSPRTTS